MERLAVPLRKTVTLVVVLALVLLTLGLIEVAAFSIAGPFGASTGVALLVSPTIYRTTDVLDRLGVLR